VWGCAWPILRGWLEIAALLLVAAIAALVTGDGDTFFVVLVGGGAVLVLLDLSVFAKRNRRERDAQKRFWGLSVNVARHVRVVGRVQGVFFRQSAVNVAEGLDLAGWVRNCPDGSVEAHLEGDEISVGTMIEWLRLGPPDAQVDEVRVSEAEIEGFTRFELRH